MPYDEYDEHRDSNRNGEVPSLRVRVGETETGASEGVPELQAAEVGYPGVGGKGAAGEEGGFVYFVETSNGEYVKIGYSTRPRTRLQQLRAQEREDPWLSAPSSSAPEKRARSACRRQPGENARAPNVAAPKVPVAPVGVFGRRKLFARGACETFRYAH